jgi:hypothetical protein
VICLAAHVALAVNLGFLCPLSLSGSLVWRSQNQGGEGRKKLNGIQVIPLSFGS